MCDLVCETPLKIYCSSCVQEHVQSTRRNKYVEKTKTSREIKTRRKYERTRQTKMKLRRRNKDMSDLRGEVKDFEKKLHSACVLTEGDTASLLHQLWLVSRKNKYDRTKYNNYIKEVAVNILYHSPSAYSYLRETLKLPLPHRSTLMKVTGMLSGSCGFVREVQDILKEYSDRLPPTMKYVSLIWDEMSIKSCTFRYLKHSDRVLGLVDYGLYGSTLSENEAAEVADHALVFAIQNLAQNTFQPIGYFFTHGQAKSKALAEIIEAGVRFVNQAGLSTFALLCDAGTSNCAALKQLGLTSEGHQVDICDRKLNVFFDPVHNVKCSRNAILEKKNGRYTTAGKVVLVSNYDENRPPAVTCHLT